MVWYIFQNLDLTEMRAVMAVLPDQFENDPNGEKEAWRTNILETIRAGLSSEEKGTLNKEKIRAKLYFEDGMHLQGPYNPNAPLHEFSLTTSDAFAPTSQFQMVSRIDDNVELSNRRSSITGESVVEAKPIKRQVEQLDIQKFADNPEMQRRREAFSKDKIMNNDSSSSLNGSGGYHRSMSMSDIGNQPIGRSSHVTELFTQRSMNDENNNITRPKTQWEIERESLALIMAGRDERTAFDPKANNTMNHNNGNSADWEIELAKAKAYQQQKVIAENNQPPPTRQKNRNSVGVASSGSLLTAGGTLGSHHQVRTTSSRSRRTTRHSTGGKGSSQPWAAARQRQQTIPNGSRGVQNTETRKTMRASDQVPLQRNERIDIVNKYKL